MTKRFEHGLVMGKFYPLHAGHSALIRRAAADCARVTVQVLGSALESIPLDVRASWIREVHPDVEVVAAYDEHPVDFDDPVAWDLHMAVIRSLLTSPVDAVFTSDEYGIELARRLGAQWIQVDPGRLEVPMSGTAARADPAAAWWALSPPVRAWFCRRVVVLGAESTGTTTLARDLAAHYGTTWVPEYGRTWTEKRPGGLTAPWESWEFDLVAERQAVMEDAAARTAPRPLIICDTDVLATAIWHERYIGSTSPALLALAEARRPDLYLLTDCDVPFVQDGMRDGEHLREWMTDRFCEVLGAQPAPWIKLAGTRRNRLAASIEAVDSGSGGAISGAIRRTGRSEARAPRLRRRQ